MSRGDCLEFAAEGQVGFYQSTEEVIIKEKTQNRLHKYKLQTPENIYQEMWSEDLPRGVNAASVTAANSDRYWNSIVLQDKRASTTLVLGYDSTNLRDSWRHEGILLTCFSRIWFVYSVETEGEYEIVLTEWKNKDSISSRKTRLKPSRSTWLHPYLSVCEYRMDRIVVTSADHTLHIYEQRFGE